MKLRMKKGDNKKNTVFTYLNKLQDIPTHGNKLRNKKEVITRFYFENVHGTPINSLDKLKKEKLRRIIGNLEVDIMLGVERRRQDKRCGMI